MDNRFHNDKVFTNKELSSLTTLYIHRFLTEKLYGREDPGVDDNPTEGRSTTPHYYKKTISYFMLSKLMKWTVVAGIVSGNPANFLKKLTILLLL